MDDPVAEISEVILKLTTGSPRTQQQALEQYFVPQASFFHPFCSVHHNRAVILSIFQWYKILSPHIDLTVNSIAYDEQNLTLYINISQIFRIFLVPFYSAPVTLTTVLQLERGQNLHLPPQQRPKPVSAALTPHKYYIRSQNDLYQVDQFVRFFLPWGLGTTIVLLWHWFATLCCIVGARVGAPVRWSSQRLADARPVYPDVMAGDVVVVEKKDGEKEAVRLNGDGKELTEWEKEVKQVVKDENRKAVAEMQQERQQF